MMKRDHTVKLIEAIQTGNCQLLKDVCQSDFSEINRDLCTGQTPLGMAIRLKKEHIVEDLLELGADVCVATRVHPVNPYLFSDNEMEKVLPLDLALHSNHLGITSKIFEKLQDDAISRSTILKLLRFAIKEMAHDLMSKLLSRYGSVTTPSHLRELLKISVLQKDTKMVELLAVTGVDVNGESNGVMPLVYAANNGDIKMCLCLMELGALIDASRLCSLKVYQTPLQCAIDANLEKAVSTLLLLGSDPNGVLQQDVISHTGQVLLSAGSPVLHLAVIKRNPNILTLLVDAGALWTATDARGNSTFHVACERASGDTSIVQKLLEMHRNPNADRVLSADAINFQNNLGQTPLMLAIEAREVEVVQSLLHAGASVKACDSQNKTVLHAAVKVDSEELTLRLLRAGCGVDGGAPSQYPYSPLHLAINNNNWTLVDILLEYGADINLLTSSNQNALHLSIRAQSEELVSFFLKKGLSVNAVTERQVTPLMLSVKQCNTHLCGMLIDAGSNLNITDDNNDTALDLSVYAGCERNTHLLIVNGADMHCGNKGWMSLNKLNDCTVKLLITAGARISLNELYLLEKEHKVIRDSELYDWLLVKLIKPHSLQDLCRKTIRNMLMAAARGISVRQHIDRLQLPTSLVQYLMFDMVDCYD